MGADTFRKSNRILDRVDKRISIALMASFVVLIVQYFILIYFNLSEANNGSIVQQLSKGLVGLIFLYSMPTVLKRSLEKFIVGYFIAALVFLLYYVFFPENRQYIVELIFPFFFMCLPVFLYTLSLRDFSVFKSIMLKASYIVFLFGLFICVLVFTKKVSIGNYSMSLSYYMLLPTILFLDRLFDKLSIKMIVFTILSLLVILALGSRGPVLCVIVFILLKFIRPNQRITHRRIVRKFSVVGIGLIIIIFSEQIFISLYHFFLKFGINSRTLNLFLLDRVYLSGRDKIYAKVIDEISQNPLIGIGIAGDRRIIGGSYVHNFFMEVVGNFGIILGSIFIIGILLLIINSIFTKNIFKYNMTIIWLSIGFVHLMVSSSYWVDIRFWIFLGVLINFNNKTVFRKQ